MIHVAIGNGMPGTDHEHIYTKTTALSQANW